MFDGSQQKQNGVLEQNPHTRRFTDKHLEAFTGLAEILKKIHWRLLAEGYTIEKGQITCPKKETDKTL